MLIYSDEVMQYINDATRISVLHDGSVDSIVSAELLIRHMRIRGHTFSILQTTQEKLPEFIPTRCGENHLLVLLNLGQSISLSPLLPPEGRIVLVAVQMPVHIDNILASNVYVLDDGTSLLQF